MIKCANNYCIFNKNNTCKFNEINISAFGICEDCVLPNVSKDVLDELKSKTIDNLQKNKTQV